STNASGRSWRSTRPERSELRQQRQAALGPGLPPGLFTQISHRSLKDPIHERVVFRIQRLADDVSLAPIPEVLISFVPRDRHSETVQEVGNGSGNGPQGGQVGLDAPFVVLLGIRPSVNVVAAGPEVVGRRQFQLAPLASLEFHDVLHAALAIAALADDYRPV